MTEDLVKRLIEIEIYFRTKERGAQSKEEKRKYMEQSVTIGDAVYALTRDDLLREQEPVEPDGDNCGECGYTVHRINYDGPDKELRHEWFRFCPSCGKAVKWDD